MIGDEARAQMLEREGRLPARVVACVGGGSNAMGIFTAFLADEQVELIGVEAGGEGIDTSAPRRPADRRRSRGHSARLALGGDAGRGGADRGGALDLGRPRLSGRRAPARVPARQRPRALRGGDRRQALDAFKLLARLEGIIPALETAHALAWVLAEPEGELDLVCLSGRGDKDLAEVLGQP